MVTETLKRLSRRWCGVPSVLKPFGERRCKRTCRVCARRRGGNAIRRRSAHPFHGCRRGHGRAGGIEQERREHAVGRSLWRGGWRLPQARSGGGRGEWLTDPRALHPIDDRHRKPGQLQKCCTPKHSKDGLGVVLHRDDLLREPSLEEKGEEANPFIVCCLCCHTIHKC